MNLSGGKIIIIGAGENDKNGPLTIDKVMNVLTEAGLSPKIHHILPEEHETPKCIVVGVGCAGEEILRMRQHIPERGIIITCRQPQQSMQEKDFIKNLSELKLERHIPIERLVITSRDDIIGLPSLKNSVRYTHPKKLPTNKNYSTKPKGPRHGR